MSKFDELIKKVESSGQEIFWYGTVPDNEVDNLENILRTKLPESFRHFLCEYGGGGVIDSDISGIEDADSGIDNGGTVHGDTLICREDYGLPEHLVVIFFQDEEICWCLDTSKMENGECPVVSYSLFTKEVDKTISNSFDEFFNQYLELRAN